jgi:hypothetical protein
VAVPCRRGVLTWRFAARAQAVELPMTHPELYEDIGIKPPKGVILYGVPGAAAESAAHVCGHRANMGGCVCVWRCCCSCACVRRARAGTGKTLLAKAVANQTSATFLRVVGSELIQKYLGDGAQRPPRGSVACVCTFVCVCVRMLARAFCCDRSTVLLLMLLLLQGRSSCVNCSVWRRSSRRRSCSSMRLTRSARSGACVYGFLPPARSS